ncbi:MAG: phosphatidylglycerol lysyltransferase domain-containing protein [Muribaculaceae bacterium]|nr:phosphatidylglycerol lysyltransferase domain-containing protein [Muribaculaceae bacterium]
MNRYRTITIQGLEFHRITKADFADIARFMRLSDSRTCDYTFGGVVLWINHFGYTMAIQDNTLYIRGGREDDLSIPAFAMPVGDAGLEEAMELLRASEEPTWLSAVPEDRLHIFASLAEAEVCELGREWSDYLYDINAMADLGGGAMKRKRNHVNRFMAEHPDACLVEIDRHIAAECGRLLEAIVHDGSARGRSDFEAVGGMLEGWDDYAPYFVGEALVVGGRIVGFTVGETKGDTLHVHVEKCDHSVAGANEALASMYAAEMRRRDGRLLYVNRQDDAGDAGLRASKESWRPLRLLPKFNIRLN